MAHVVLLLLVPREDADLADVGGEEMFEDGVPERARPARDQQGLAGKRCHGVSCLQDQRLAINNFIRIL